MKINLIKPIESDGVKPNWMNISKGIWLRLIYIGCYLIVYNSLSINEIES